MQLGITEEDSLLETFDPNSGSQGRWVSHIPSTVRNIDRYNVLLYRSPGTSSNAEDMKFEIEKLAQRFKSQKRPVPIENSIIPSPHTLKKRRAIEEPDWAPTQEKKVRTVLALDVPEDHQSDNKLSPAATSPRPTSPTRSPSPPPSPASPKPLIRISNKKSASGPKKAKETVIGQDPATQPLSGHAPWPFKYVKAMAAGFDNMHSLDYKELEKTLALHLETSQSSQSRHGISTLAFGMQQATS